MVAKKVGKTPCVQKLGCLSGRSVADDVCLGAQDDVSFHISYYIPDPPSPPPPIPADENIKQQTPCFFLRVIFFLSGRGPLREWAGQADAVGTVA